MYEFISQLFMYFFCSHLSSKIYSQNKTRLIPISIYIRTSNTLEFMNAWG